MGINNTVIVLSKDTYKWLSMQAEDRRKSVAALVEEIVTEYRADFAESVEAPEPEEREE